MLHGAALTYGHAGAVLAHVNQPDIQGELQWNN
jgi:hypothetical protein